MYAIRSYYGVEANFHIVIGQIASAKNIGKCISKAGLRLNQLVLEPLASADAVLTDDEKEAGVALVDIGGGTTDIAVYYDDIIRHTAVIPFGGDVVRITSYNVCYTKLLRILEKLKTITNKSSMLTKFRGKKANILKI